jgi:hypothetical protein
MSVPLAVTSSRPFQFGGMPHAGYNSAMARKRKAPETIGEILARLMDVKRQLLEAAIASGDLEHARDLIDGVRIFVRYVREDLEIQLRDGTLEEMTPEQAQQAIYGAQILEGSLQSDYPELSH